MFETLFQSYLFIMILEDLEIIVFSLLLNFINLQKNLAVFLTLGN